MNPRRLRARLGLIDVVMLAGIAAGAVWLVLTYFTAIDPAAALLLAAMAAVATFHAVEALPAAASDSGPDASAPAETDSAQDAPGERPGGTTPGRGPGR